MKKKLICILLVMVLGAVSGGAVWLLLEFIKNGGTMEEVKIYVKDTIIPSAVGFTTTLMGLYICCHPVLKNASNASNGLLDAKDLIKTVSDNSSANASGLNNVAEKLASQLAKIEAFEKIVVNNNAELGLKVESLKSEMSDIIEILAIGFGNQPELVRNGHARQIYKIIEEGAGNEAED